MDGFKGEAAATIQEQGSRIIHYIDLAHFVHSSLPFIFNSEEHRGVIVLSVIFNWYLYLNLNSAHS